MIFIVPKECPIFDILQQPYGNGKSAKECFEIFQKTASGLFERLFSGRRLEPFPDSSFVELLRVITGGYLLNQPSTAGSRGDSSCRSLARNPSRWVLGPLES